MTVARTRGAVVVGVEGRLVEVEADVGQGLPGMTIVGLPDTAVAESRDRARAAVVNSGGTWPNRKVTVGLSPASLPKRGSGLDTAVALAVLAATGQVPADAAAAPVVVGELGLDGTVRRVRGMVAIALAARAAGVEHLVVPADDVAEAALVPGLRVTGVRSLEHLRAVLADEDPGVPPPGRGGPVPAGPDAADGASGRGPDLADVRGQAVARAALEVAAAGGHHLALLGEPGVGKTLLAERLPGLLPPLGPDAALEVTAIRSVAGLLPGDGGLVDRPPFEAPHHSASHVAIIGGGAGSVPRPGLVSLAHRGVLFLDEAPEFARPVLEALRQPLESGVAVVARAGFTARLPARFQLVLAANPCPCGGATGRGASCRCSPMERRRYAARLSGPLMDRVDLRVTLRRPRAAELAGGPAEGSGAVAARVDEARGRAARRLRGSAWALNAEVPGGVLRRRWPPDDPGARLLEQALRDPGRLTLRGADRVLRVAWTLADLAGAARPGRDEVARALALRAEEGSWAA